MTDTCPNWPTVLAWLENDRPDEESQLLNTHMLTAMSAGRSWR